MIWHKVTNKVNPRKTDDYSVFGHFAGLAVKELTSFQTNIPFLTLFSGGG